MSLEEGGEGGREGGRGRGLGRGGQGRAGQGRTGQGRAGREGREGHSPIIHSPSPQQCNKLASTVPERMPNISSNSENLEKSQGHWYTETKQTC